MPLPRPLNALVSLLPGHWAVALRPRYRYGRDVCKLAWATFYDFRNFARGSGLQSARDKEALKTSIIKSYHRIEKGLALASPRPGFGSDAIELLFDDLGLYLTRHGPDWVAFAALQTLQAYRRFNQLHGVNCADFEQRLVRLEARLAACPATPAAGGVMAVTREHIQGAASVAFEPFVRNRHSVRQFTAQAVHDAHISVAVAQALYTPSVCNRAASRVYATKDPARARVLLGFQNGNRGFGESAGAVLVVTARQAAFHTVGERYQGWIDGGMFAMTLVYALHAQGLGTCCLNWSVEPHVDIALKRAAGIPADEIVIMMLAVGHLPDTLEVACSTRRPSEEVLQWI